MSLHGYVFILRIAKEPSLRADRMPKAKAENAPKGLFRQSAADKIRWLSESEIG